MIDLDPRDRAALDALVPDEVIAPVNWDDVLRRAGCTGPEPGQRRRAPRARRAIVVALALVALGSSVALGAHFVAGWVHDEGDASVERSLDQTNQLLPGSLVPDATSERVRTEASSGEWRLYETPMSENRALVTILPPRSLDYGIVGFAFRRHGAISAVGSAGLSEDTGGRRQLLNLGGQVAATVATVEARFAGGRTRQVPLSGRWFLYVGDPGGPYPVSLVARDRSGRDVGRVIVAQHVSLRPRHAATAPGP
jgi:hypothetical protein